MKKPYIVGICGGSASGKTFLLNQLREQLKDLTISEVSQDNYYKPLEDQVKTPEGLVNFDHPNSLLLEELYVDMDQLIQEKSITREEYTFNNPSATASMLKIDPSPVIILEGLFIYHLPELRRLIDLKVFVEAEEHIKLARRLRRDISERGYSLESILTDYTKFVAPMYEKYVEPTKRECDLIIPNNRHMYKAINVLVNHIRAVY
ncbi:MAG: uridine kinase [Bacteroidota bacterium]